MNIVGGVSAVSWSFDGVRMGRLVLKGCGQVSTIISIV